jgi:hypothetical protein
MRIVVVLGMILLVVLGWFAFYSKQEEEGFADLTTFSDTIGHMFMTPPTQKTTPDATKITRPTFDVATKKAKDVTYYLPKGWCMVMINENIPDPSRPIMGNVPRMTMMSDDCQLDVATGSAVPKDAQSKTTACLSTLDITSLKTSKDITKKMDANTQAQVEDFFTTHKDRIIAFYSRDAKEAAASDEVNKDMEEYDQAMQKEDYKTAFEESQSALEAAKKEYAKTHAKSDDKNFDPSKKLLQFDAAMPVFWDNALLQSKDNLMPLFKEPGSFRDYGKTYVPSYEDSVFLSQSTGLPKYAAVKNSPDQMSGFCQGTDKEALEEKCNSLATDVCASTDCCVLLGGSKCVAGNVQGPSTPSHYSDFTIQNRDFYYFKGKCYGNCYQNGASSMYLPSANKQPAT